LPSLSTGTIPYASDRALLNQCRVEADDLESLGYSLLELEIGFLPWDVNITAQQKNKRLARTAAENRDLILPERLRKRKRGADEGELVVHQPEQQQKEDYSDDSQYSPVVLRRALEQRNKAWAEMIQSGKPLLLLLR
jgi:hypothetical protein